jgi:hypothetical protein
VTATGNCPQLPSTYPYIPHLNDKYRNNVNKRERREEYKEKRKKTSANKYRT